VPASRFMEKGERVDDVREPWFAGQLRSRYEINISAALEQKCVGVFLAAYPLSRRRSEGVKRTANPLFPGYTFGETHFPLDRAEVDLVGPKVSSVLPADPWPFRAPSQIVRVLEGPLAGAESPLVEARACQRAVAPVPILRRSVAIEVDAFRVRPATLPCPVHTTQAVAQY
jgi:hypothetical protein